MRTRRAVVASVVLGAVLVALGALSWSALASIRDAQELTLSTRQSGIAYSDLRQAVADEAFAEAGYRRAPGTAARARLEQAIGQVDEQLAIVRTNVPLRDGPIISQLSLLNQRYVDQVRSTLDTPVVPGDDRVAGPALDAMQRLLAATLQSHRTALVEATRSEVAVVSRLRWTLPSAFGLALLVLGGTLRKLLQEHRRIGLDAARATELAATRERLLVELRELEQRREEFRAMVAHDLSNPITVIAGYADLIADEDALPPEVARHVQVIQDRSRQMRRLVDDLSAGASPSTLEHVVALDLAEVVQDAVDACSTRAQLAGVSLTSRIGAAAVNGDPDRLRQVVDNLVGNAIKYTPAGERVEVETGMDGSEVVLRVSDTGIGIPEDQLPHVFDSYYRATTAQTAGVPGTGLGLAITKQIIEGHHGTIRAAGGSPRGTMFEVRIPRADLEPA